MAAASNTSPAIDALGVIEEEARAVAQFFGIGACDVAAQMLADRIAARIGGQAVYLAGARTQRDQRDIDLRRRFNAGEGYAALARDMGLSERQVRRIVYRKTKPAKN